MTTEENQIEIDDTNAKFRTRVSDEIYPAFVENRNMKSTIVVSPYNVSYKEYTLQNAVHNQEQYDLVLSKNVLHGTGVENRCKKMTITYSNVQFSYDKNLPLYNGSPWANPNVKEKDKFFFDTCLGLPQPFVAGACAGLSIDPLNCISSNIENEWGGNGLPISTKIDEYLLDAYHRMNTEEFAKQTNKLWIADKIAKYSDCGKYPTTVGMRVGANVGMIVGRLVGTLVGSTSSK